MELLKDQTLNPPKSLKPPVDVAERYFVTIMDSSRTVGLYGGKHKATNLTTLIK